MDIHPSDGVTQTQEKNKPLKRAEPLFLAMEKQYGKFNWKDIIFCELLIRDKGGLFFFGSGWFFSYVYLSMPQD